MNGYRQGLIDEIGFWRELISESSLGVHSPGYERMEYALQLAETKLTNLERVLANAVSDALKH
jgi:hypothetical protein